MSNDKLREALIQEAETVACRHPLKDFRGFAQDVFDYLTQQPESEPLTVSVDMSTGEEDSGDRIFATIVGKQDDGAGGTIYLAELDADNRPQPSAQVPEDAVERMAEAGARDSLPRNGMFNYVQREVMCGERMPEYRRLAKLMLQASGISAAPSIAEKS